MNLALSDKAGSTEYEKEALARLLKSGIVIKEEQRFIPQIPIFKSKVFKRINEMIDLEIGNNLETRQLEIIFAIADNLLLSKIRTDLYEQYVNWVMQGCLWPLPYVLYEVIGPGHLKTPKDYSNAPHALYLCIDRYDS